MPSCGAALEPTASARCEHCCHHQVVVPSFVDLRPLLDTVEPLLRTPPARAARPGERLQNTLGDNRPTGLHRYLRHFSSLWEDNTHPEVAPLRWVLAVMVPQVLALGWLLFR